MVDGLSNAEVLMQTDDSLQWRSSIWMDQSQRLKAGSGGKFMKRGGLDNV
jgi:hypothetical protein